MLNKIIKFIKQINCNHIDTKHKSNKKGYKYMYICNICGAKYYEKERR